MTRGGKREGSGRPKGSTTNPTWLTRVSTAITKEQIENIPSLMILVAQLEEDCNAHPGSPRYYHLEKALHQLKRLGY